jgi:hypothetical protein
VFQTYVASVSIVLTFVAKVDLDVAHVAVEPNCSNHLLQLLCPPACAWVWRGCHGESAGHEACMVHGAGAGHGAVWPPRKASTTGAASGH